MDISSNLVTAEVSNLLSKLLRHRLKNCFLGFYHFGVVYKFLLLLLFEMEFLNSQFKHPALGSSFV